MIRTVSIVAARDLYEHLRSPLTMTLVVVCAGLTIVAVKVRIERWRDNVESVAHLQKERDALRQSALTGAQVALPLRAIRPVEPLSVLASGTDEQAPWYWDFTPSGLSVGTTPRSPTPDPIDLELLIRVIIGLLASTLAVDSIAGQRDRGELLALLGQSVRAQSVLLGKLLAAGSAAGLALATVTGVALATSYFQARSIVTGDFVATSMLLGVTGLLYCLVWICIGFAISSMARSYGVAWSATFALWTVFALVGVNSRETVAQAVAPVRSAQTTESDRERAYQARLTDVQNDIGDTFAAVLGGISAWPAHQDDAGLIGEARSRAEPLWLAHAAALRTQLDAIDDLKKRSEVRHERIVWTLTVLNPAATFFSAAANLTGTGEALGRRRRDQVTDHQAILNRALFDNRPRVYAHVAYFDPVQRVQRRLVVSMDRRAPLTIQGLPALELERPSLRRRIETAAFPWLNLSGYLTLSFWAATMAFRHLRS